MSAQSAGRHPRRGHAGVQPHADPIQLGSETLTRASTEDIERLFLGRDEVNRFRPVHHVGQVSGGHDRELIERQRPVAGSRHGESQARDLASVDRQDGLVDVAIARRSR